MACVQEKQQGMLCQSLLFSLGSNQQKYAHLLKQIVKILKKYIVYIQYPDCVSVHQTAWSYNQIYMIAIWHMESKQLLVQSAQGLISMKSYASQTKTYMSAQRSIQGIVRKPKWKTFSEGFESILYMTFIFSHLKINDVLFM